jgi:S1-C subfamily serine protease
MIPVVASDSEMRVLGLPAGSGALKVSGVIPGLPADRAGLVPGDFIVRVNGRTLKSDVDKEAVQQAADGSPEGFEVALLRQGQREVVSIRPSRSGRG